MAKDDTKWPSLKHSFNSNTFLIPVSSSPLFSIYRCVTLPHHSISSPQHCSFSLLTCMYPSVLILNASSTWLICLFQNSSIVCFTLCHIVFQWPVCWQLLLLSCGLLDNKVGVQSLSYYTMFAWYFAYLHAIHLCSLNETWKNFIEMPPKYINNK